MQEDLFSIILTEEGSDSLLRFFRKARLFFVGSVIWTLVDLFWQLYYFVTLSKKMGEAGNDWMRQMTPFYLYVFVAIILVPFQGYFYFAFSKKVKQSIAGKNSEGFNRSFRLLNINAVFCLIALFINFLYVGYSFFSFLNRNTL
jgi:hypothetical protein